MMEENSLTELTREIMTQGFGEEKASELAVLIGDTPCFDAAGNVVVMDGGRRVTTLKPLKFFSAV
jgi:hypothetical protein